MKISNRHHAEYPVEDIFAARSNQQVREQACRLSGALSWKVTISAAGDATTIRVDRAMPPTVPDVVRRFVGEQIDVRQVETWHPADEHGERRVDVRITIEGQPASADATIQLVPAGTGSDEIVRGSVVVSLPFFGGKIEPEIAKVILKALEVEQASAENWLAEQR